MASSYLPRLSQRAPATERNQAADGGHVEADGQGLHAALKRKEVLWDESLGAT